MFTEKSSDNNDDDNNNNDDDNNKRIKHSFPCINVCQAQGQ